MPTKFGRHPNARDTQTDTHTHTQVITIPSPPLQKGARANRHTQVITIPSPVKTETVSNEQQTPSRKYRKKQKMQREIVFVATLSTTL